MKQTFLKLFLAIFFISAIGAYSAEFSKNSNEKIPLPKNVKVGTLSNGFTYYIMKNAKPENRGHFRLVIKAGAINEDDDQNGLAHFQEHMCFNGTKNYPKNELLDVLQKLGVRFGADVNASTGMEVTMYELPISVNDPATLKNSFQVLEDWAHNVNNTNDDVEAERGVLLSEWRQRNNANGRLNDLHAPKIFYNSKYAKRNVIGDTFLLKNFNPEVIRRFYKDWYRPDLMALVAVGDFDVDQIEKMIIEHFSKLQPVKNPRPDNVEDIPFHKQTLVSVAKDIELPYEIARVYVKLPLVDEKTYSGYYETLKRQIYDIIFNERVRELTTQSNPPFVNAGAGEGSFYGNKRSNFMQTVYPAGGFDKAFTALMNEAMNVKQNGYTASELERAKTVLLSYLEKAYNERASTEHSDYVNELSSYFSDGVSMAGIENDFEMTKSFLSQITLAELNQLTNLYYTKENCVVTVSVPDKEGVSLPSETMILTKFNQLMDSKAIAKKNDDVIKPLFDKKITPGKITKSTKNDKLGIEELVLSNGAKIILKPTNFKEDEILISAYSFGGLSLISDKDFYSGQMAANAVTEAGISGFKKNELTKVLAGSVVGIYPSINEYTEEFNGSSSKKDLEKLFQLTNLYFTDTRKDEEAFKSFTQRITPYIENRGSSQDDVYADSVAYILGNHHFRRQPLSKQYIDNSDYERAYNIFKERFNSPSDFTFIFVGDFKSEEIKPLLEKYIASIAPATSKETYKDLGVKFPNKAIVNKFNKGKEERAHVRLSFAGDFNWTMENRHIIQSLSELLDIKLTEKIREELGATYSAGIWPEMFKIPNSQYVINIDFVTDPKRVDEIVNACKNVITKIINEVDKETTFKVQKAQEKQREISLKENGFWVGTLNAYSSRNEDLSTILNWDKLVKNLKAEDIKKAAKTYLNLDKMIEIVAMPEN